MSEQTFAVGDKVTAHPDYFPSSRGIVYTVTKAPRRANEKNYIAFPDGDTTKRGIKAPAFALVPWDGTEQPTVTLIDYVPTPEQGSVVRVAGLPNINPEDYYIVLGDARKPNAVRLVKMGGDGGRYWPSIPVSLLTVVPAAEVAAALALVA